jgi:hypothetical protein
MQCDQKIDKNIAQFLEKVAKNAIRDISRPTTSTSEHI